MCSALCTAGDNNEFMRPLASALYKNLLQPTFKSDYDSSNLQFC